MVIPVPEDVKLRTLRERIIEASRNERTGLLIIPMGVFLVSAGLIISIIGNGSFAHAGGIVAVGVGVLATLFGFLVCAHYAQQYNALLRELDLVQLASEVKRQ